MPSRTDKGILDSIVKAVHAQEFEPLTAALERYLLTRNGHPNRMAEYRVPLIPRNRPGGRFSPSNLGGCMRQSAFAFMGVKGKTKKDPQTELIFEDGNWRHHKWQAFFKDMEGVLGRDRFRCLGIEETVQIPTLFVRGSLDLRIAIKFKGKWFKYVIDIKGSNEFGFEKIFRERIVHPSYVRQVIAYVKAKGYERGMLFFDAKNTQRTMAWPVEITAQGWSDVEDWLVETIDFMSDRKLPPKHEDCENGNFMYGKCPFASLCFGDLDKPELRKMAYAKFKGVEEAWEEGLSRE